MEKNILPPLLQGFEPATFESWVRRCNHWAIPGPLSYWLCVCACVCACVHVCAYMCVRACVHAGVRACVCVCVCVSLFWLCFTLCFVMGYTCARLYYLLLSNCQWSWKGLLHVITWKSRIALVASWITSQEVSLDPLTMGSESPVSWDKLLVKAERMLNVTTWVQKRPNQCIHVAFQVTSYHPRPAYPRNKCRRLTLIKQEFACYIASNCLLSPQCPRPPKNNNNNKQTQQQKLLGDSLEEKNILKVNNNLHAV